MMLNWLQSILLGFVSGLTEFLPVSSNGHQAILFYLFGNTRQDALCNILIRLSVIVSIFVCFRKHIERIFSSRRGRRSLSRSRHSYYEKRLLGLASIPMLAGILLYALLLRQNTNLALIFVFLVINGVVLLIAEYSSHGNKDARTMSALDALCMGVAGAASAFPGLSRFGMVSSAGIARGADRRHCFIWSVMLLIPALLLLIGLDFTILFSGHSVWLLKNFICYVLVALSAYFGSFCGIKLMIYLVSQRGAPSFAYYSWGLAIFTFVLFLIA